MEEIHLVDFLPAECGEHIVLVGMHELVGGRHHIESTGKGDCTDGELLRQVFLLVERVDELRVVVVVLRLGAIGVVPLPVEVGMKAGSGLSAQAEAQAVDEVVGNDGIDGADIELVDLIGATTGFHVVLYQHLGTKEDVLESLDLRHPVNKVVHRRFALGELSLAVIVPKVFIAHPRRGVDTLCGTPLEH